MNVKNKFLGPQCKIAFKILKVKVKLQIQA